MLAPAAAPATAGAPAFAPQQAAEPASAFPWVISVGAPGPSLPTRLVPSWTPAAIIQTPVGPAQVATLTLAMSLEVPFA